MGYKPVGSRLYQVRQGAGFALQLFGLFLTINLFLCCAVKAQQGAGKVVSNAYRTVQWTEKEGLFLGKKNIMLKDVNGFLWIVSPVGLYRFDGSRFKTYYPDKNTPGTIGGAYTFSLVEDSLHNIWVGTNKGISRYDIRADTFKNFTPGVISVTSVATCIPFWATQKDVYCLEAGNELVAYDVHTLQKHVLYTLASNKPERNNINVPNAIYDQESNSVWMLTGEGKSTNGGLLQIVLAEGKTINYEWPCPNNITAHMHYAYNMRLDKKRNCIWLSTVDGLLRFSLREKKFYAVKACLDIIPIERYEFITGLAIDQTGLIWFDSDKKGILIYDPESDFVAPLFTDSLQQKQISKDNMSIYADKNGMMWCGYLNVKGICQLIPFAPSVTRLMFPLKQLHSDLITPFTNVVMGDSNRIWVGTVDGIVAYDPKTGLQTPLTNYFPGIKEAQLIPAGTDQSSQKVLLKTFDCLLYQVDLRTKICKRIRFFDMNHSEISGICPGNFYPYKNGFVFWVDKVGVFAVNNGDTVAQQVLAVPYHVNNMAVGEGNKIFLRLHFGYTNLSFYEKNGRWTRTATAIDSIEWYSIFYDKDDTSYWVGAVKQLYHLDHSYRLIRSYTEKDGFPGVDVLCIQKDNLGNIWFVNAQYVISRLNVKTGILTTLSEKDGYHYQHSYWTPANLRDNEGNIYFAGAEGIDKINPKGLDAFPSSTVYFQSLTVNEKPFPLSNSINQTTQLSLRYSDMPVAIEAGAIDYYAKGQVAIRYRLENLTKTWQYAPANYVIRFEKLPPGDYKLVVQASNSGNNFSGPEKVLFIHVSPAFWNTWWFRVVAIGILAALIFGFLRWRLQQKFRLQLAEAEKERQVAELKQKATELEMQALRAQMNPHFIFNSLNSINRFILQNDKAQASEYLANFSRLIRLILQNSSSSLISLESELESLSLYLDLEALRFNNHFDYKLSVPNDLDVSDLQVPPLILQPYVENAIWHGLMHREEKGSLDIELSQEEGFLYFKITDNGIGRKHAALLKSKSAIQHKSLGHQNTALRIASMQQVKNIDTPVMITDLVNADGSAAGTEVLLKLPVIYD